MASARVKSSRNIDINTLTPLQALILLLLDANDAQEIKGKTWLQKEMFLVVHNVPEEVAEEAQYEPHHYGPYSETIDSELDALRMMGLVEINDKIKLRPSGQALAKRLKNMVSKDFLDLLSEIKRELNDLSEDELLAYIYFTFPEMTVESRAIERIMRKRMRLAISLYKKGKVSLSKAAQIAGVSVSDFIELLRKRKTGITLSQ